MLPSIYSDVADEELLARLSVGNNGDCAEESGGGIGGFTETISRSEADGAGGDEGCRLSASLAVGLI